MKRRILFAANRGYALTSSREALMGVWRDNVFVERLWRTIKYKEVYLRAYASVSEARAGIGRYLRFCNNRRAHSSLDGSPQIRPTSISQCPTR